jgi:hypothetical protein
LEQISLNPNLLEEEEESDDQSEEIELPLDIFRDQSINPTIEELQSLEPPYLIPIVEQGAFTGLNHYLEVCFCLLKEEFSRSLREGLHMYKQGSQGLLRTMISHYDNAEVLGVFSIEGFFGLQARIHFKNKPRAGWEVAKKLNYG